MSQSGKNSFVLVIIGVLASIALGSALGFYHFEKPVAPTLTLGDSLWWAMVTMTTIGYGDFFPRTLGGRLIALFLMFAGIGTLSFLTAGIASYFIRGDGWQRLKLRRISQHVIICGLGRQGLMLVRAFRAKGRDVVVIEAEESNDLLGVARALGAVVLVGDARERAILQTAAIARAGCLIALCGDDGINAEIAARARDFSAARTLSAPLLCSVHIVDPELWFLLREWEMSGQQTIRLQFFNLIDTAARALLDEHPPFVLPLTQTPRLLLVGAGRLGGHLLVHIARQWHDIVPASGSDPTPKLNCVLIDREVGPAVEMLHLRHPELGAACEVSGLPLDTGAPEFHRGAFLFDSNGDCAFSQVYICLSDDAAGLSTALAIHSRLRHLDVPIIVALHEESGLAALLRGVQGTQRRFGNLHAVGLMERACQPDLVLGGIPELLARALHERYLEEQETAGVTLAHNPLLVSWDELPEEARESNRAQALHMGEKLAAVGYDIAPLSDWNASTNRFTELEIEQMARLEHDRWMNDRLQQGWHHGARDVARKLNPNLMEWEKLPENTRAFNRDVVGEIPTALARAGFQIHRLPRPLTEPKSP